MNHDDGGYVLVHAIPLWYGDGKLITFDVVDVKQAMGKHILYTYTHMVKHCSCVLM